MWGLAPDPSPSRAPPPRPFCAAWGPRAKGSHSSLGITARHASGDEALGVGVRAQLRVPLRHCRASETGDRQLTVVLDIDETLVYARVKPILWRPNVQQFLQGLHDLNCEVCVPHICGRHSEAGLQGSF